MSETHYIKNGKTTSILDAESIKSSLEVKNYAISFSQLKGFQLIEREEMDLPKKIYGNSNFPDRVLNTYHNFKKGMGVLLSGPKGTGKTIEAKSICVKSNMPVILLTEGFSDSNFSEFLESIKTPSVIFIDEFEKIYIDEDSRNFFLSVLDGVAKSRHLFLLTSNTSEIGEFFDSRPSRVRYHKHYDFLSEELICEIIDDRLIHKDKAETIKNQLSVLPQLSVDSLVCIIDECNLYNELPKDFSEFFNVCAERPDTYAVQLTTKNAVPKKSLKNKNEIERANELCYSVNTYDDDDLSLEEKIEFDNLCTFNTAIYESLYCKPFVYDEDDSLYQAIECYLYTNDKNAEKGKRISWRSNNIVFFEQNRKGFTAKSRDGSILTGTPIRQNRGF
jgi:DNA replication protein DnaC